MKWLTCVALFISVVTCAYADDARVGSAENYPLTRDSLERPNIARGKLEGPFEFRSEVIPSTVRRYWVYIPADYRKKTIPNLLVFQDGQRAISNDGAFHIPTVLDNLISQHDIPSTLAIFVTPGQKASHYPHDLGLQNPDNRMAEYDAMNDRYARMLIDELLPEVAKRYRFSSDPKRRIIGGSSSGAICAFTVAWHRPDAFANVISLIGSYTSIGYQPASSEMPVQFGGDLYPTLIRKSPIRPLRIFLQDGRNDINNEHGDWFLANQQMLSALQWANTNADANDIKGARYDINYVWGDGGHSDQHGAALLPDILRWLWRDQIK